MVSHIIKVLDRNRDLATFWYLYEHKKDRIKTLFSGTMTINGKISYLEGFADKLKKVRDKIYFHSDKRAIFDAAAVWKEASLQSDFLAVMTHLMIILTTLHRERFKKEYPECDYNGADAYKVAEQYAQDRS